MPGLLSTPERRKFLRKVLMGEIELPIVRMEGSQKTAKGVHAADVAADLDKQADAALERMRTVEARRGRP